MFSSRHNHDAAQHGGVGPQSIPGTGGHRRPRLSGAAPIPVAQYIPGQSTAPREVVAYARLHALTDLGRAASNCRLLAD